jgi:hypothetical protein
MPQPKLTVAQTPRQIAVRIRFCRQYCFRSCALRSGGCINKSQPTLVPQLQSKSAFLVFGGRSGKRRQTQPISRLRMPKTAATTIVLPKLLIWKPGRTAAVTQTAKDKINQDKRISSILDFSQFNPAMARISSQNWPGECAEPATGFKDINVSGDDGSVQRAPCIKRVGLNLEISMDLTFGGSGQPFAGRYPAVKTFYRGRVPFNRGRLAFWCAGCGWVLCVTIPASCLVLASMRYTGRSRAMGSHR